MLVYFLRHAIAQDRAATDSLRDLNTKGLAQAPSITEKFKQHSPVIDRVLCSPYNRAQQTASAVITQFSGLALTLDESIKSGGDVCSVLDAIEELDVRHFLIVSHNPFLSNLLSVMVDGTMESQRYVDNVTLHCVSMNVVASVCGEIAYTLQP